MTENDSCPCCAARSLEVRWTETLIPLSGRTLVLTSSCSTCGYRHIDTIPLEDHGPLKQAIKVRNPDDLAIRIVRSGTASIEIPELGLRLDPGVEGQSFITNIEGVLVRFEDAVNKLKELGRHNNMPECHRILHRISLARQGKTCFTVILEDPGGNSFVIRNSKIS